MRRGSSPMTSGARSSIAPTTARVWNSSVASPSPTSPGTSVSTWTKIQLRNLALTTTVLTAVIFIWTTRLRSPTGQRLAADAPVDQDLQHDRDDDHETEGQLGVERVDARRHDASVDRTDDERCDKGPDHGPGAAKYRRAAEEDRRDGIEERPFACGRPEIIAVDRAHEAAEDGSDADQHEGLDLHPRDIDAHEARADL